LCFHVRCGKGKGGKNRLAYYEKEKKRKGPAVQLPKGTRRGGGKGKKGGKGGKKEL